MLRLYGLATSLIEPLAAGLLKARVKRGKEDASRLGERLGYPGASKPRGPVVWLHGASVGESLSLLPLVARLRTERPDLGLLVTSGTVTAATLLTRRLPVGVVHQYAPIDAPRVARRFLNHWRPKLVVFVESELWPNLLLAARRRGAKLALVSARMTESSAQGWRRFPGSARAMMGAFDLILPQDDEAAARLESLGGRTAGRLNLKYAGQALPVDPAVLSDLRFTLDSRPVLLAASTHPGEDTPVLEAFAALKDRPDKPLLVIVPRHPERGVDVARLAMSLGFEVARRGAQEPLHDRTQVYVGDTLGELGLWMRLARTALVAGSLTPGIGGHNPLEAIRLDCPVLSGPHVRSWQGVYDELASGDAVRIVQPGPELTAAFEDALTGRDQARAARALAIAERQAADLEAGFAQIEALLP
jgi:3-deoxy-D-manno-octulosonic-acid transferase